MTFGIIDTAHAASSNLPAEPNRFIGRERDIDEVRRCLAATRAVTLCGTGGIGKTRLALQVISSLADQFPDGVWLIELGDLRQPGLVISRVASAIGIDEEAGRPLLETLTEALRPRRLLLMLDNCEHLIDACARLCQRLLADSPLLRVIATSREPLRVPAETVWRVPPLSIPPVGPGAVDSYEAIRLFVDRAAAARPGFVLTAENAAAMVRLCRALDGVPLAIELAAARVRALSVGEIAARLGDRFRLLGTGDRTAPPRQQTMRAAIDWSHGLLTEREQVLLRRLSVFAGWSLEMAEQVCTGAGIPVPEVLDLTTALVDKSLVAVEHEVLGQARYRMLDSVRQYAAERLAVAAESERIEQRLRDYILRLVEHFEAIGMARIRAPWSESVNVFRRYDIDQDNALQVLARCLAYDDAETGLRICTAMRPLWTVRGLYAQGAEWFDRFLALNAPGLSRRVRGAAMIGRAQLALPIDPAQAGSYARAGFELCRASSDSVLTATALNLLAETDMHAGRPGAAEFLDEALALARPGGDTWNEGYALGSQAAIAAAGGRLREAQQLGEAALAAMRGIDQQWGTARTLLGLGSLARLQGDPAGARRHYQAALPILREIDARPEIARCLAGLGRVALDQGDVAPARQYLAESLRLSHSTGARTGVARGLEAFASLAAGEGYTDRAVTLAAAAAALRAAAGLPPLSGARTERYLAPARRALGEPVVGRLWAHGHGMPAGEAVALAFDAPGQRQAPSRQGSEPGDDRGRDDGGDRPGGDHPGGALPDAPRPAMAPPATLTPREREIVTLLARGLSNKAIAADLFISPATAARHVANILAKLGFTSRTQVAAWAAAGDRQ
jgi:predicted ATPase/DNA-binding CsgD family transcriptional regulator